MTLAAGAGFEKRMRATRKAAFLACMDGPMRLDTFCALIDHATRGLGYGLPPAGLERMLRMFCAANWFNLANEACDDALYDFCALRKFCRIDLGPARVPDATTLHCASVTAANVHDRHEVANLLHGKGTHFYGEGA